MVYIAIVVLLNYKTWYKASYATSGVYLINPDGGTSFEVSCSIFIDFHITLHVSIGLL